MLMPSKSTSNVRSLSAWGSFRTKQLNQRYVETCRQTQSRRTIILHPYITGTYLIPELIQHRTTEHLGLFNQMREETRGEVRWDEVVQVVSPSTLL